MAKKSISYFILILVFSAILLFSDQKASAVTININVSAGGSGSQSQTFNVPAGFTSVKITGGGVDDRGSVSINGTLALFQCSSWLGCAGYGDNGSWAYIVSATEAPVPSSSACSPTDAISFPVDITSLLVVGVNTMSAVVDNCGGGPTGFSFDIEIVACTPDCTLGVCTDGCGENCPSGTSCNDNNACSSGDQCNEVGNCAGSPITCDDGKACTLDSCNNGVCSHTNACGGIVPCGRKYNDPSTHNIDESKPCQLCHLFVLLDRIIDFLFLYVLFPLAVLMIVLAGILYISSVFEILPGGFQTLNQAKGIIFSVVIGIVVIFASFILIGLFFKLIGLADWTTNFYQNWWSQGFFQINCQVK